MEVILLLVACVIAGALGVFLWGAVRKLCRK